LAGDSIVHCEKKVYMNVLVIINVYREEAVGIQKYKSIANGKKLEINNFF